MKILRLTAENFGSYPSLELDLSDTGLALIYGPTGAGKSTVMDAAAWILYGTTAKDGSVDDVRSWKSPDQPTRGTLHVELSNGAIAITRVRGAAKDNDLFWTEHSGGDPKRGKDLKDTQRLLEARLGVSSQLYLAGAYFHEFSPSGQFFTASAKERRSLFERIADTKLPDRLASAASEARKSVRGELETVQRARDKQDGVLGQLRQSHAGMVRSCRDWQDRHDEHMRELQARSKGFEVEKASKIEALQTRSARWEQEKSLKLEKLLAQIESTESKVVDPLHFDTESETIRRSAKCKVCGSLDKKASDRLYKLAEDKSVNLSRITKVESLKDQLASEVDAENPYAGQIEAALALENHYAARTSEESVKANPFSDQLDALQDAIRQAEDALKDITAKADALEHRLSLLSRLYDLSFNLRGELLRKAVSEIEGSTNRYLESYFDAELRVSFSLDADDLDVTLQKSGYNCNYHQLSKGQRGLLKLCFGVSVQGAAANAAGIHFDNLFFDEALDGLDSDLKIKAFSLFEELSINAKSILIIEHSSEFREMFARRLRVTLEGDESAISDESEDQCERT